MLELRGVDRTQAEDLVQEVGLRAMSSGVTFDGLEDFLWWAVPVARNLHIDLLRSSRWSVSAAELPDRVCTEPAVEHVVERRLALEKVLTHLSELPDGDREAIVAGATETPVAGTSPGTAAVRRHRARATLRRMVGTALGLTGGSVFLRRLRVAGVTVAPVSVAAMLALPALVLGVAVAPEAPVVLPAARPYVRSAVVSEPTRAVLRAEVAGGAARGSRAVAGVTAPAPEEKPFLAPTVVEVTPAGDRGLRAERRDSTAKDPLLCVMGGPFASSYCIEQLPGQVTVKANDSLR